MTKGRVASRTGPLVLIDFRILRSYALFADWIVWTHFIFDANRQPVAHLVKYLNVLGANEVPTLYPIHSTLPPDVPQRSLPGKLRRSPDRMAQRLDPLFVCTIHGWQASSQTDLNLRDVFSDQD